MKRSLTALLLAAALALAVAGCAAPGGSTASPDVTSADTVALPPDAPQAGAPAQAPVAQAPVAQAPVAASPTTAPATLYRAYQLYLYRPAHLIAGKQEPLRHWQVDFDATPDLPGLALAPDGETVLLYPTLFATDPRPPVLIDLPTRRRTPLPLPPDLRCYDARWLPDGRLMLAGQDLWVGGPRGEAIKRVATGTFAGLLWPSPDSRHVALWGSGPTGAIRLVDLGTGAVRTVTGPFRKRCQGCGNTLAWSPDGKYLAGSDYDHDAGSAPPRIRIIDPFADAQVRTIEGFSLEGWLPDGNLMAYQPPGPASGASPGAPSAGGQGLVRINPTGRLLQPTQPYDSASPDGRYLLQFANGGLDRTSTLLETASGAAVKVTFPGAAHWTPQGDLLVYFAER